MKEAKPVLFLTALLILETTSNLLQPDYSIKIVNTENIILSLGDLDDENQLEMIPATPDPNLEQKLLPFHKFINSFEKKMQALQKASLELNRKSINFIPDFNFLNENQPYGNGGQRYGKKLWKYDQRKLGRKRSHRVKLKKKGYSLRKSGIVKRQMPEMPTILVELGDEGEYDYKEKDYWNEVKKNLENNTAFKYTEEGKPEESVKDIFSKITDVKTPKNCSAVTGVGVQAVECVVKNYKDKEIDYKELIHRIAFIILIWFAIYVAFAVPLWCARGWCCCCFQCQFCKPVEVVRDIQRYVAQNPPGVYVNENGEEEHYNPTSRETELYEKLTRSIADF